MRSSTTPIGFILLLHHWFDFHFGLQLGEVELNSRSTLGAMTASASKLPKPLKLKGTGKVDNKALAAGALTARTNLSTESADNGVNLEVLQYVVLSLCAKLCLLRPQQACTLSCRGY